MREDDTGIIAKIHSLHSIVPQGWENGPYDIGDLQAAERRIGRSLDKMHRGLLEQIGGNFTFEIGSVDAAGGGDVNVFFGVGDPYDIVKEWSAYSGQIPQSWYTFAMDAAGHVYGLTEQGEVHHIHLEEELWTRDERPKTSGRRVADSFADFVMSLRLPDWAIAYYEEQHR